MAAYRRRRTTSPVDPNRSSPKAEGSGTTLVMKPRSSIACLRSPEALLKIMRTLEKFNIGKTVAERRQRMLELLDLVKLPRAFENRCKLSNCSA